MAKKKHRATPLRWTVPLDGDDAAWGHAVERLARAEGKDVAQVGRDAIRKWLWDASGLGRTLDEIQRLNEMAARCFQVEGLLVDLARSPGISLGQQSDYARRAQDERRQYDDLRKRIVRLVKHAEKLAQETALPEAAEAVQRLRGLAP